MAESVLRITIDSRQALINAQAVNKELNSIEKNGDFASKSMDSLSVATRTLAGHMAGLVTVGAAVSKMDAYTGLQNRLKLVTNSQVELNKAMSDTFAIAQKTRQSWESAAQVYQGFANNAKALGLTMSQTAQLTETVSKAVAISGGSAASSEAALIQFNQALGAGALRGEELNSVMEQTPGLAKAIAEGMGITVGQLRTVAAQGKITSEELVKALTKAKSSVDDLFSKTDITIGQSITLLNNELSKFVGEAGQSSGAAKTLADSIQVLSQNIDLATNAVMIGGAYWAGTYIPTLYRGIAAGIAQTKSLADQTAMRFGLIQAERAAAAQEVASATAKLNSVQSTMALVAAEKALELQRTKNQISMVGQVATGQRMAELRKVEAQVTAELTAAETALTAAKARSSAAATASLGIGSKLLGVLGGPVGIGFTVATLAASYLLMRDNTAKATEKLAEQTDVANKTKEELLALQGVQKKGAISDLEDSFKGQNEALKKLNYQFNSHVIALQNDYKSSVEIADISNDVRKGIISQEEAIKRLNKLNFIDPEQLKQLEKDNELYREKLPIVQKVQEALKVFGVDAELAGNKATNASHGINDIAKEAITTSSKVKDLSADIQKFINDSLSNISTDSEVLKLRAQGISKEYAEAYVKLKASQGLLGKDQPVDMGAFTILIKEMNLKQQIQNLDEKDRKAEQEKTKELEKQQKIREKTIKSMTVDSVIARGEGGYNSFNRGKAGDSIGSKLNLVDMTVGQIRTLQKNGSIFAAGKYQTIPKTLQGAIDAGIVSSAEKFTAEVQERIVQQYLLTAKKGRGSIEDYITGKSDNLTAANLDLAKEFASVASPLTGKSYYDGDKASNKSSISVKDAQNALKASRELYAQAIASGKSAQEAWKAAFNGSISFVDGSQTQKDLDKFVQEALKTQQEIDQLRAKYDSDAITRNKARIKEISDAEKLGQLDLIPKIKERYDAQDDLAKLQFNEELNGYKWNEVEKLEYQKRVLQDQLNISGRYAEAELKILKKAIDDKYAYQITKAKMATIAEQMSISKKTGDVYWDARQRMNMAQGKTGLWSKSDFLDYASFYEKSAKSQSRVEEGDAIGSIINSGLDDDEKHRQILEAQQAFEDQRTAITMEAIKKRQTAESDAISAQLSIANQGLGNFSGIWSNMTSIMKDSAGEQSGIYKTMFFIQQQVAVGQAVIQAFSAYGNALANIPAPYNVPMASSMLALGLTNAAMIEAQALTGFATGGYTGFGGKYVPAGIVHKGEVVFSQEDIARWGGVANVEAMRLSGKKGYSDGGIVGNSNPNFERKQFESIQNSKSNSSQVSIEPKIVINNNGSSKVTATSGADGKIYVTIDEVEQFVANSMARPNSKISKSVQQNTTASRRR
ncbi:tape measure protein [Acinetobacter gerneri]|uniref:Tape measure protein N-terminal domain-containing protein n=1 Tax=Acinetobacter gerneri DSM 14967 = CIP 107464 = MTCC 9824 TaxID=1120926 RepID=N8YD94_9GAMM|nr:tape measure protein [Acinetobacter gerneri]ENV34556.1 hypothetical protein F960_01294 [Acinetobacter gerneri DSM 14967 = CIP 107464 = MTCC 9824]EPR82891.1 Phage-related tail protein [Acinetobacter gerneri DSM 14967 = CIP 107464 = MTCC 9824]